MAIDLIDELESASKSLRNAIYLYGKEDVLLSLRNQRRLIRHLLSLDTILARAKKDRKDRELNVP